MKSHQGEICLEKKMYEPKHTAKKQGVILRTGRFKQKDGNRRV